MFDAHPNLAIGNVLTPPSPATSGTTLVLRSGQGLPFEPNMPATLAPADQMPTAATSEIVYVTAVDGDALTVLRAQEGTTAKQVRSDWAVYGSATAKTFTDLEEAVLATAPATELAAHVSNLANPHQVTKTQVGLGNVDNTNDASKPISTATQTALDTKATASALAAHTANVSNPHAVTKTQIGLENVDNSSDMNKPVSTAQATALNLKADANYLGPIHGQENIPDTFLRMERTIDPNKYKGLGGTKCVVPTSDPISADGEVTHPSVVYTPEKWNGYYYWMAATPYASSNDAYEDPIILASNDGLAWEVPAGLTNPLDDRPGGTQYNSDTHLVFGPNNVLYVFWRYLDTSGASSGSEEKIYVRTSTNGVTWTTKQLVYQSDQTVRRILSPSFYFYSGVWHMWGVDIVGTKRVVYATATSLTGVWSTPVDCTVTLPASRYPWHLFVSRVGDQWVGLLNDTSNTGATGQNGDLILMTSLNGTAWNVASAPCVPRAGTGYTVQYRSSFVPKVVNGIWGLDLWHAVRSPNYVYRTNLSCIVSPDDAGYVATSSIAAGANAGHAVTFAAGLFTEPPVVTATSTNGRLNIALDLATLTKTGVTINAYNWTTASAGSARIYWRATQR